MAGPRTASLAVLLGAIGCSGAELLLVSDAPLADDAPLAGDAPLPASDAPLPAGDGPPPAGDAPLHPADAPPLADVADGAASMDRCAPGAALLARVDAARLLADLDALVGLGDRSSAAGQARAAAYLRAELTQAGLAVREQGYLLGANRFVNLEVTITGDDEPDRLVMAGAHYDAAPGSPGADDNASGATAVLEAARALAACRPRRSVRLVWFSNEEASLAGSKAYVAELKTRAPPAQVLGFIAVDMVAFPPQNHELALVARTASRPLAEAMTAAVDRFTTLPTALSVGDDCG